MEQRVGLVYKSLSGEEIDGVGQGERGRERYREIERDREIER